MRPKKSDIQHHFFLNLGKNLLNDSSKRMIKNINNNYLSYDMVMKPIDTFSNEYIHRTPDHLQESISTEPITFESYLM